LKNLSKYHVLISFLEFFLSILITYFSHLSPLSISTLNHFFPYLFTLSTPLSLILPYLAIFQSMAGGRHPPHSFTLPSHLPHPRSRYLHFSPFPLNTHLLIGFVGWQTHLLTSLTFPSPQIRHPPNYVAYNLPSPLHHPMSPLSLCHLQITYAPSHLLTLSLLNFFKVI
jgi:hypothetical protein